VLPWAVYLTFEVPWFHEPQKTPDFATSPVAQVDCAAVPTGLLLLNLGTPDAPDTTSVRRYLREFLSDPRVIDVNAVGRALLLNLIILPFRPARSAHAYQSIWTDRGSPLLYHSIDLAQAVADRLGDRWQVELAMRYGQPSIAQAMVGFQRAAVDRIVVFPLFPQYATSSTGTAGRTRHGGRRRELERARDHRGAAVS